MPDISAAVAESRNEQEELIMQGAKQPNLNERIFSGVVFGGIMTAIWTTVGVIIDIIANRKKPFGERINFAEMGSEAIIVGGISGLIGAIEVAEHDKRKDFEKSVQAAAARTHNLEMMQVATERAIENPDAVKVITREAELQPLAKHAAEEVHRA